ncbi:MAG: hypothetical protein J5715_10120 [Clostridiales bacterium]|nr:hypothetical protein [Clostridiales bacterium]
MSENTNVNPEAQNNRRNNGNKNRGNNRNNYNGKRRSGKNYSGKRNYNNDRDNKGGEERKKKERPVQDEARNNNESQPKEARHTKFGQSEGGNFKRKREKNFKDQPPKKKTRHEETVDDIRTDNARITKEIYLEISSIKDIKLD